MNQREAKHHVCQVAATVIQSLVDLGNIEFFECLDSIEPVDPSDMPRVTQAIDELVGELERRGR